MTILWLAVLPLPDALWQLLSLPNALLSAWYREVKKITCLKQ
tara:strand:- start:2293 stop:2418 length:126 start_codon:yes stop_codon:yes gene_type:complete